MLDFKYLDNDADYTNLVAGLVLRGAFNKSITRVDLDRCRDDRRQMTALTTQLYTARAEKNILSKEFGQRMRDKQDASDLKLRIDTVTPLIAGLENELAWVTERVMEFWFTVPNIPRYDTPAGLTEADNIELPTEVLHKKPEFGFAPRDHIELGQRMGCMDFEQTAKISGARFVTLSGALARLERVLGQWMLDMAIEAGYRETSPPHMVKGEAMRGTGQLPKFEDDLFRAGVLYLIPTAEVSLTNLVRDTIMENGQRNPMVALTPCYRAEAGSAGRDTRGMIRLHQFNKVELVNIVADHLHVAEIAHEIMWEHSAFVLGELGLNYRLMHLCGGDLGFSAISTFDLEVWMPAQNCYREIASISNCGTFQARRMNARYRSDKGTEFVHTLNGSGVAVGRALVAVMENYQTEDGGIAIPLVLRERMGGSFITPDGSIL